MLTHIIAILRLLNILFTVENTFTHLSKIFLCENCALTKMNEKEFCSMIQFFSFLKTNYIDIQLPTENNQKSSNN